MESDTEVFLNGSVKFPFGLEAPWKSRFYAEQYVRNQWVSGMVDRKIPDMCDWKLNPAEIWYPYLKDQTNCPIPIDVNILRLTHCRFEVKFLFFSGKLELGHVPVEVP
jgi:hypothetical protein